MLDVACGTGALIPDYINRKESKCVAVDISSKMIENARKKFGECENIEFLCADAKNVSTVLPETEEMTELMKTYFNVDIKISTNEIYIVSIAY